MSSKIIACGYEIVVSQEAIVKELKKASISVSAGTTSKMGLYFGTGSVGAPIQKTDNEISEWAENHQATLIVNDDVQRKGISSSLTLIAIYYAGVVFGEFIDKDGTKFIGPLLNPKNLPVIKAKDKLASATKQVVKSAVVTAIPYIWFKVEEEEDHSSVQVEDIKATGQDSRTFLYPVGVASRFTDRERQLSRVTITVRKHLDENGERNAPVYFTTDGVVWVTAADDAVEERLRQVLRDLQLPPGMLIKYKRPSIPREMSAHVQ